jgi:hypothetical protein
MLEILKQIFTSNSVKHTNEHIVGEFTYKTFTTMGAAPVVPRITKLCSDSVTIQWVFSQDFFLRLQELKKIFQMADRDRSGNT